MDSQKNESPGGSFGGALAIIAFGAVFMAVGALMFWGLTRDLDARWAKALEREGYGTPAEIREAEQAHAAFLPLLAAWKERDAQRLETVKAKLTADADEGTLERELEALRDAAEDWEPRPPMDVPKPLPEGWWARFAGLSTDSRKTLFAGPMVAPAFFLPGLFIALGALLSLIREGGARRLAHQHPNRPWLHVAQWSALQGRSHASGSRAGIVMMLSVFGWAAFCVTLMWALEPEPEWNFTFMMAMANFAAGVIALLAVRLLLQGFKYGQARLLLAQVPFEPGKTFSTRLMVPRELSATEQLNATLRLQELTTSGSGKNQRTHFTTVYKHDLVVPRAAFIDQGGRLAVELRFEVPADQPTSRYGVEPGYQWRVEVEAQTPGLDFEESFEVPVYPAGPHGEPTVRTDWQR